MPKNEGQSKAPIVKVVSGTLNFGESLTLQLRSIRIYTERHLTAMTILGLLIIGSALSGFFMKPWLSCLINLLAGLVSVWLGYTALTRVKEIKIHEGRGKHEGGQV